MAVWQTPVTDWVTTDYINISTDFTRVEGNTEYLRDVLVNDFGKVIPMTFETWANTNLPYFDEINRMEGNINTLNSNWATPTGWVTPKTDWVTGSIKQGTNLTGAQMMNRMEVDLNLLYESINGTSEYLLPCGTFTAGNDRVRQHFTRS